MNPKNVYDQVSGYFAKHCPTCKIEEMFDYGEGLFLFTYSDNGKIGYGDPYVISDGKNIPLTFSPMEDLDRFMSATDKPIDISKFQ